MVPKLIDLYKTGLFLSDELITQYKFEKIPKAVEDFKNGKVTRAVIKMEDQ
ncbi:hypothetical protein [Chryseobacterium sp. JK1]|uniref:hypothetical protein n=1 Tax=Chryseobacterium sp. JK1 TaxID=874294 RepID=UPI003D68CA1B